MHQNQWIAALKELEEEHETTVPSSTVPKEWEATDFSYDLLNFSEGEESKEGSWMSGKTPDGEGLVM
ncbi:Mn-containing catalase [Halobacillus karajensis]|uniref:manganese catalase family protein n=1 Tax=Halobacillus karajensis TaxID=195088 RepID=UPI0008A7CF03|nr:manganese catalase family protein [Halobacillus karajensis]SEI12089.1 Mn-containing catalase [Halobacillus karajensis]